MNEKFIAPDVEILLEGLRSQDHFLRKTAIESIGKYKLSDKRIVTALQDIAFRDSNIFVKQAATDLLLNFEDAVLLDGDRNSSDTKNPGDTSKLFPSSSDEISAKNRKDFWTGIGIGFALYLAGQACRYILFMVFITISYSAGENFIVFFEKIFAILPFLPHLINIGAMIYFEVTMRRKIALGILTASGFFLVVSILLVLLFLGFCFTGGCSGLN